MASLTPSITSAASGTAVSWTLVIDGIGASANWTLSNNAFGSFASTGTYLIHCNSLVSDTSCYVVIYNTDGTTTNLSSTITLSSGSSSGTYVPILDYTAPTVVPKHIYMPELFNTTTGSFGFGLPPFRASIKNGLQLPYISGYKLVNSSITAPTKAYIPVASTLTTSVGSNLTLNCLTDASIDSLVFTWYKNGTVYSTDTNPTFANTTGYTYMSTLSKTIDSSDIGAVYSCVVSNTLGQVTSNTCTISLGIAPTITTNLVSTLNVVESTTATFTVVASGDPTLTYQWFQVISTTASASILGATSATYSFTAQITDSGKSYFCIISNPYGYVNSAQCALTVTSASSVAPTITTQPTNVTVIGSQTATFNVVTTGSNLAYQWYLGAYPTPGGQFSSTSSTCSIVTANSENGLQIWCVISNGAGSVTSNYATLTVTQLPAPTIVTQPSNASVTSGSTATYTAAFSTPPAGCIQTYQWYAKAPGSASYGAVPTGTSGDTTLSISISNVSSSLAGYSFICTATNTGGSVTTTPASLTVDGNTGVTLVSLSISPATVNLRDYPDYTKISVIAHYSDSSTQDVTNSCRAFSTANSLTASWWNSGYILAQGPGTTTLTAAYGSTLTATVTVNVSSVSVTSATITPVNSTISIGASQQFIATATWSDASVSDVTLTTSWASSATSVATINTGGTAYGVANGNTTITAIVGTVLVTPFTLTTYMAVGTGTIPATPTFYRPTTGTGVTAFPSGVDGTSGSSVDAATATTVRSIGSALVYTFTGFGTGTFNGKLNVRITTITADNWDVSNTYEAVSSVDLSYVYNGGATTDLFTVYGGSGDLSSSVVQISPELTSVDLSTLTVTLAVTGKKVGVFNATTGTGQVSATATATLYDVVFLVG